MSFIHWTLRVLLLILFYREGIKKYESITAFSAAISEYKVTSGRNKNDILAMVLICLELSVSISMVFRSYAALCTLGIVIQIFYLFLMIKNKGAVMDSNCGCYTFSLPKKVDNKSLLKPIIISYLFLMVIFTGGYGYGF